MPHIEQPLQLIILSIKVNKYKKLIIFSSVFKVMEYPQTHTHKFNLNLEKKRFSLPPPPFWRGGGGGAVATPLLLISGMTPLGENFYHSFLALTLIGAKLEIGLQSVKCKNVKRKKNNKQKERVNNNNNNNNNDDNNDNNNNKQDILRGSPNY